MKTRKMVLVIGKEENRSYRIIEASYVSTKADMQALVDALPDDVDQTPVSRLEITRGGAKMEINAADWRAGDTVLKVKDQDFGPDSVIAYVNRTLDLAARSKDRSPSAISLTQEQLDKAMEWAMVNEKSALYGAITGGKKAINGYLTSVWTRLQQ